MNTPALSLPGRDKPIHTKGGIKKEPKRVDRVAGKGRTGRQAIPIAAQVIKRSVAVAAKSLISDHVRQLYELGGRGVVEQ